MGRQIPRNSKKTEVFTRIAAEAEHFAVEAGLIGNAGYEHA